MGLLWFLPVQSCQIAEAALKFGLHRTTNAWSFFFWGYFFSLNMNAGEDQRLCTCITFGQCNTKGDCWSSQVIHHTSAGTCTLREASANNSKHRSTVTHARSDVTTARGNWEITQENLTLDSWPFCLFYLKNTSTRHTMALALQRGSEEECLERQGERALTHCLRKALEVNLHRHKHILACSCQAKTCSVITNNYFRPFRERSYLSCFTLMPPNMTDSMKPRRDPYAGYKEGMNIDHRQLWIACLSS